MRSLTLALACLLLCQLPLSAGTGVVDRVEGDRAVLVLDDGHEAVVALDRLPPPAREPDAVVLVIVVGERLRYAAYRPRETRRRTVVAQARFDRVANRSARRE